MNPTAPSNRLIVVGGSVTGLYTAIAGAKAGYDVTLVEKYDQDASRRTVFNLAPVVADSLAHLDDGTGELTGALTTIVERSSDDSVNGQHKVENAGPAVVLDPASDLDASSMSDGFSGADPRPWSRVQIAGIENHMREYIARRYPQIETRYNTSVESISQARDGVTANLVDSSGAKTAVEGAWLVSATGGRNVLGIERQQFPEIAHYVGGLFEPVTPDRVELKRVYRPGSELAPETHDLNPPGKGWATVGLPGTGRRELPDTLVWAQINRDAKDVPAAELAEVVRDRAKLIGLGDLQLREGDDSILRANVQLSLLRNESAVQGHVLLAGDELLGPYFPTSTGASHGLGVSGPLVEQALRALREPGVSEQQVLDVYDVRARQEAAKVMEISRAEMLEDLGQPAESWNESLSKLGKPGVSAGNAAP